MHDVEAVTVSVGYGDFLGAVARYNRGHFRQWVVVTADEDVETREVCRRHDIRCVVTKDHTRDGAFSKGRLIERGLQHLSADCKALHIDADICLPLRFGEILEDAHLEDSKIYGCDRFMVKDYESWVSLIGRGWPGPIFRDHPHLAMQPLGFGTSGRWAGTDGWVPCGFFQLWSRKGGAEEWRGTRVKAYPSMHGTACRTDIQHALQWDRRDRVLIPELFVAHLEPGDCTPQRGANWKGRTTPRFGPAPKGAPSPPTGTTGGGQ